MPHPVPPGHRPRRRRFGPFDELPDDVDRLLVQHHNAVTGAATELRVWRRDHTWPVSTDVNPGVDQSCWRLDGDAPYADPQWNGRAGWNGRALLANSHGAVELHAGESALDAVAPPRQADVDADAVVADR